MAVSVAGFVGSLIFTGGMSTVIFTGAEGSKLHSTSVIRLSEIIQVYIKYNSEFWMLTWADGAVQKYMYDC